VAERGPLADRGLLAEFASEHQLADALDALLRDGYVRLETFTPLGPRSILSRLGKRPSFVTYLAGLGALVGIGFAYWLQWYLNAWLYPLDVGGRPLLSIPAWVPITFELGVLFTALTAFFTCLVRAGMFRVWRPVFEVEGFERATIDRWFVLVDCDDRKFEPTATRARLLELGALRVAHSGAWST
jgi:hypothetical protein